MALVEANLISGRHESPVELSVFEGPIEMEQRRQDTIKARREARRVNRS